MCFENSLVIPIPKKERDEIYMLPCEIVSKNETVTIYGEFMTKFRLS